MPLINFQNGLGLNCLKRRSLATASSSALMMMLAASGAYAQQSAPNNIETVVVTSTRILSGGLDVPTPHPGRQR